MATDNLPRIARKLIGSLPVEDGAVFLSHDTFRESTAQLSDDLRDEADELFGDIRAIVPNDFAFCLSCSFDGINLSIEFVDGNTHGDAGGGFFTSRKSMMRKIRSIDWDARRSKLIEEGSIFEKLVSEAQDRPVNIPSSAKAAGRWATELADALTELQQATPSVLFAVVVAREDEGLETAVSKDASDMRWRIADFMTHQFDVLAVIENGTLLGFDDLEARKLGAAAELGPISRAKAERRFG